MGLPHGPLHQVVQQAEFGGAEVDFLTRAADAMGDAVDDDVAVVEPVVGQTGPDAALPGYDYLIQGRAGLMSITGLEDGAPGAAPMRVGVATVDLQTGLMGAIGLLAALYHREKTGPNVGQASSAEAQKLH